QRPVGPPVATNVAETLKVQSVPEDKAKRKLQIKNGGEQGVATNQKGLPAGSPRGKLSQIKDQDRENPNASTQAQTNAGEKSSEARVASAPGSTATTGGAAGRSTRTAASRTAKG